MQSQKKENFSRTDIKPYQQNQLLANTIHSFTHMYHNMNFKEKTQIMHKNFEIHKILLHKIKYIKNKSPLENL